MTATTEDTLTDREFRLVSDLVYRHCGINLHDGKKDLVQARLAKRVRHTGAANASEYLELVQADATGGEFATLIDEITTNLTSFFRESAHFDHLREKLLPELIARKSAHGGSRIRAWSAGCSTGEEPYSLAATILEAIGNRSGWDAKVLATDISRPVLRRARAGTYDRARAATVPPEIRARLFEPGSRVDGSVAIAAPARERVVFNYLNLMEPWPFKGPFDFIFCRNVMIYFDKPTQQRLVGRFWDCLAPGGMLFTGHSESLTGVAHKFKYVLPTIYAK